MTNEVKILKIESLNGLGFEAITMPAPVDFFSELWPEMQGLPDTFAVCSSYDLMPVPSVVMRCDGYTQLTSSDEAMAVAKFFRSVAIRLRKIEAEQSEEDELY